MLSSYTRIQIFGLLAVFTSLVAASDFEVRANALTLPAIFKNATAQVTSLTQQLNRECASPQNHPTNHLTG